jgi:hypothetical protein
MNIAKILLILAVLASVASAFVDIPQLAAIAAIGGAVYGVMAVEEDQRVYFLMVALVLSTSAGALGGIPELGRYLTDILTTLGAFAAAAAIGVICKGIFNRLT